MGDTIKFKRGLKSGLPQLNLGEPALVLDEKRLYIGGQEGNIPVPNQQDIEEINTQLAQTAERQEYFMGLTVIDRNKPKRGIVTFWTDDGDIADWTVFRPIFNERGIPFVTAIVTNTVGNSGKLTLSQLLQLQEEGHEIASHGHTHQYLTQLSDEEVEYEIRTSKEWLTNNGFKGESLAFPFGDFGEREKEIAKKYFRSARSSEFGTNGLNDSPIPTFELVAIWLDGNVASTPQNDPLGLGVNTFQYYKHYIDQAHENNSWLIICFHSWESLAQSQLFIDVVDYAMSKCDILTASQALDKVGNVLEVGSYSKRHPFTEHIAVGYNGVIDTNNLDFKFVEVNKFDGTNHIDDFEDFKVTVNRVNTVTGIDSGLPECSAGTLYTFKPSSKVDNNLYNYQLFVNAIYGTVHIRRVNSNKEWEEWEQLSANGLINETQFTPDTPLSSFDKGFSVSSISSAVANQTNAPEKRAGILITYKVGRTSTSGYNYQEYHIYGSEIVYKRSFNEDGTPKEWKQINSLTHVNKEVNKYDPLTPISDFELGITLTRISTPRAETSNAPEPLGGVLITFKTSDSDNGFNWQEYRPYNTERVYIRKFALDGTPGEWALYSFVNIDFTINAYDAATPISSFPMGVTRNRVNAPRAAASGAPESKAGVLITNKIDTNDHSWNWQEYHIYGTSVVYKRSFSTNGEPTSWTKISAVYDNIAN